MQHECLRRLEREDGRVPPTWQQHPKLTEKVARLEHAHRRNVPQRCTHLRGEMTFRNQMESIRWIALVEYDFALGELASDRKGKQTLLLTLRNDIQQRPTHNPSLADRATLGAASVELLSRLLPRSRE